MIASALSIFILFIIFVLWQKQLKNAKMKKERRPHHSISWAGVGLKLRTRNLTVRSPVGNRLTKGTTKAAHLTTASIFKSIYLKLFSPNRPFHSTNSLILFLYPSPLSFHTLFSIYLSPPPFQPPPWIAACGEKTQYKVWLPTNMWTQHTNCMSCPYTFHFFLSVPLLSVISCCKLWGSRSLPIKLPCAHR